MLYNAPSLVRKATITQVGNALQVNGRIIDPDAAFMSQCMDRKVNDFIAAFSRTYVLDVTTHCNVTCKYCYYRVDNTTTDRSIESILDEARVSGYKGFLLMGAEPTTRSDLPELIRRLTAEGFRVVVGTNGKKLLDPAYLGELKAAGMVAVNYSMHFTESFKLGRKKAQILKNILEAEIPISQLSFTVSSLEEIRDSLAIVDLCLTLGVRPEQFAIRAGAALGACKIDSGLFMSDMMKLVLSLGCERMKDGGSNLYYQEFIYKGSCVHLTRHPANETMAIHSTTGPMFGTAMGPLLAPLAQFVQALGPQQIHFERALSLDNKRVIHEYSNDFVTLRAVEQALMPNRLWIHCEIRKWGLKEAKQGKTIWPAFQAVLVEKGYKEIFSCIPETDRLVLKWQALNGMVEYSRTQDQIIFRKEL